MKTHKEMKLEYKLRKSKCGVFRIKNLINGKMYVAGSKDLEKIWNSERFKLNLGSHKNKRLQQEWKDYGESSFEFAILYEIPLKDDDNPKNYEEDIKAYEELLIEEYDTRDSKGYN